MTEELTRLAAKVCKAFRDHDHDMVALRGCVARFEAVSDAQRRLIETSDLEYDELKPILEHCAISFSAQRALALGEVTEDQVLGCLTREHDAYREVRRLSEGHPRAVGLCQGLHATEDGVGWPEILSCVHEELGEQADAD